MTGPSVRGQRRLRIAATAAVVLALVGVAVNLWRPLAPDPGVVVTDLDTFLPEVLRAAAAYRMPRYVAAVAALLVGLAVPAWFVLTGAGRRLVVRLAGPRAHSPLRGALVAVTISVASAIAALPVAFWSGFVHAGDFGFRTQGLAGWLRDFGVGVAVAAVVAAVAGVVVVVFLRRAGRGWPWEVTVVGTVLAALLVLAWPLLVQPLTLSTRPLQPGPARDAVAPILAEAGMADVPILVGDASSRTTMVNAFVTGLGPTRQVVIYDNLLELPVDQVAVTVAHELAHREHADIPRGVLLTATGLLPALLVMRRVLDAPRTRRVLDVRGPSDPRLIAVVALLAVVGQTVALPVASAVSRRAEAAADHRAVELAGRADTIIGLTRTFTVRDLSLPDPPTWTTVLWGSHPSVGERIRAAVAQARRLDLPLPTLEELRAAERAIRHPRAR